MAGAVRTVEAGRRLLPFPTLVDLAARALALAGVTVAECHDEGYPTPLRDAVVRACCKAPLPVRTHCKSRRQAYDQADRDIERDRLLEQRPAMLRKKPKQGKQYANTAAFNADLEEWKKERDERKVLVALNARNLAKLRVFPTPLKPRPRKPQEQLRAEYARRLELMRKRKLASGDETGNTVHSATSYPGVSFDHLTIGAKRYRASPCVGGRSKCLGYYFTAEDGAAVCAAAKAIRHAARAVQKAMRDAALQP
jgi:hypothetical protein